MGRYVYSCTLMTNFESANYLETAIIAGAKLT